MAVVCAVIGLRDLPNPPQPAGFLRTMITTPSDKHSRTWTVGEIPTPHPDDLTELEICVGYTGDGNAAKGVCIDHFVIPLMRLAPRLLEVVHQYTGTGLATLRLSKEELAEVARLSGVGGCSAVARQIPPQLFAKVADALGRRGVSSLAISRGDLALVMSKATDPSMSLFVRQHLQFTANGCLVNVIPTPSQDGKDQG